MNIRSLKSMVKAARERQRELLQELSGTDNPQTQALCKVVRGKIEVLEDVMYALNDNRVPLGLLAQRPEPRGG